MMTRKLLLLSLGLVCGELCAPAQGSFQNLGFESATIVPVSGDRIVDFGQAFPAWAGYVGGAPHPIAIYNDITLSLAGISIIDTSYQPRWPWPVGLIEGNYTAVLISGVYGVNQVADATIVQTGLVPLGTKSLQFKANFSSINPASSFGVMLGGQPLSLVPLQGGTNYVLYGADIEGRAGQTAELRFTAFAYPQQINAEYLFLDSIQFSDQRVPEPGVFGLFTLGGLLVGWRVVRRRQ